MQLKCCEWILLAKLESTHATVSRQQTEDILQWDDHASTYGHRCENIELPVRSAELKLATG